MYMKKSNQLFQGKSFVTRLLVGLLILSFLFPPGVMFAFSHKGTVAPASGKILPKLDISSLPSHLGKVESQWTSPDADRPQVILIQDAHAVQEAQESIEKLIQYFYDQAGVRHVALEGGSGFLDTLIWKNFPDKVLLRKVMQDYGDRGELSGPQMSAIFSKDDLVFQAIEDPKLYADSLAIFQEVQKEIPIVRSQFLQRRQKLDRLRERVYSSRANDLHVAMQDFRTGKLSLENYVKSLYQLVQDKDFVLESFPHLSQLFERLNSNEEVHTTEPQDLVWEDPVQLMNELEAFSQSTLLRQLDSKAARELYQSYEYLHSLEKMSELKLSREEWIQLQNQIAQKKHIPSLEAPKSAREFYQYATERDQTFTNNIATWMNAENIDRLVMIAGGFHSSGIEILLREHNINYLTIRPQSKSVEGLERYIDLMQGKLSYVKSKQDADDLYQAFQREILQQLVQ